MSDATGQLASNIDEMLAQAHELPEADIVVPEYERVKRGEITPEQAALNIAAKREERRRGRD